MSIPNFAISALVQQWEQGWYPCNPSIAEGPEGYAIIITCRDLWRNEDNTHVFADNTGTIRTRNFFARLDDDLMFSEPLRELPSYQGETLYGGVRGIEDPRLYWQNEWRYSGSIFEHHSSGIARLALCSIDQGVLEIVNVEGGPVKNLMPTGTEPPFIDAIESNPSLHGGAVVEFDGGFIGIVHEVEWPGRWYKHRFARFDRSGRVTDLSDAFSFFGDHHVEFASGIVCHQEDFVISFGVMDRETYLARVSVNDVLASLR